MTARQQINMRVSDKTRTQIDTLAERWGCSITEVITISIDRTYTTELKKRKTTKETTHARSEDTGQ